MIENQISILKANGRKEAFDEEKLRASLLRSGATQEAVEEVTKHIMAELHDGMTTDEVYKHAFDVLRKWKKPVAIRYALRRAVMDLGPSGFPFEKFVAEIFKAQGFETATGQMVLGGCVPHEVDVVAWNEKKLIMCEAKFHNELGTKSDLKVVLYVKARFDDLRANVFNFGGKDRPLTDGWLITNTKFSSTAIHYVECQNLTLIGWNYPEKGNLQDMIEEAKVHPLTSLGSLPIQYKKLLIEKGLILSKSILEKPEVLIHIGMKQDEADAVIEEINQL